MIVQIFEYTLFFPSILKRGGWGVSFFYPQRLQSGEDTPSYPVLRDKKWISVILILRDAINRVFTTQYPLPFPSPLRRWVRGKVLSKGQIYISFSSQCNCGFVKFVKLNTNSTFTCVSQHLSTIDRRHSLQVFGYMGKTHI
jgi:hypothetical protein